MTDIRSLLRNEQASRRITHPNLAYTKSGLLNCLVCHLIIKSETLWEGHLRSPNHKKNLLKAQNGGLEDANGTVSKKRKISDERDDVRKRKRSTGVEQEDIQKDGVQGPEEEQKPPTNNGLNDVAGPAIPDDDDESSSSSAAPALPAKASTPTQPPQSEPQPQIDEDEWAAFEREVVPLAHQNLPAQSIDYSSATISAAPVSAAELAAQTNAERQQRRDAEVEDEKAEEETRLVEEFEVMEGLEERVKRLKEKREALRMGAGPIGDGTGGEHAEGKQKPPDQDDDDDEDDSDEVDEWGFA
jgi:zinc finger protein 830